MSPSEKRNSRRSVWSYFKTYINNVVSEFVCADIRVPNNLKIISKFPFHSPRNFQRDSIPMKFWFTCCLNFLSHFLKKFRGRKFDNRHSCCRLFVLVSGTVFLSLRENLYVAREISWCHLVWFQFLSSKKKKFKIEKQCGCLRERILAW